MPLTAQIETLIETQDVFYLVRDQIAAILAVEIDSQRSKARAAGNGGREFDLRVFRERSRPWELFPLPEGEDDPAPDAPPIVNVSWGGDKPNWSRSNAVDTQFVTATYNLDVIACGVAHATSEGQAAGDETAERNAQKALGLVRKILMAAHYVNLGLRGVVGDRRWMSREPLDGPDNARVAQNLAFIRMPLEVTFLEHSPEHVPVTIDIVGLTFDTLTSEVLVQADFPRTGYVAP